MSKEQRERAAPNPVENALFVIGINLMNISYD